MKEVTVKIQPWIGHRFGITNIATYSWNSQYFLVSSMVTDTPYPSVWSPVINVSLAMEKVSLG